MKYLISLTALTFWGLSMLSFAEDTGSPVLSEYEVRYETTAMGFGITLTRTLSKDHETYTLRNAGEIFVASIEEKAIFSVEDDHIIGQDFFYRLTGLVRRKREVHFDREAGVIRSLRKGEWSEHPWQDNVLDRLSQQEQLRLTLLSAETPPETLSFEVVDGERIKSRQLALVGEEIIDTAVGQLDTVRYRRVFDDPEERASDIWLAKDFDYVMVLTRHDEDGTDIEISLKDGTIDGRPLEGS
ncbi:DUF3108 domain-containing protein [Luminiphilus syltensis]|nr:DUF3108 domain-containing protein [Luminiphilus syltensis]